MKTLRILAVVGAIILCLAIFMESRPDQAVIYEGEIDMLDLNDRFDDAIQQMKNRGALESYHKKAVQSLRRDIAAIPAEDSQLAEINDGFLLSVDTLLEAWELYEDGKEEAGSERAAEAKRKLSAADRDLNK